ncbi:hypothetical protein [Bacillus sp. FJAT-22090]|uniref:hypothetical protein n=1 Tax=Bacillus sp. FJAT-22090 TaxID=1581038 RepID=UPI00119E09D5|nr:hypothetical protein [Bacillus sp. FJAT-22090]
MAIIQSIFVLNELTLTSGKPEELIEQAIVSLTNLHLSRNDLIFFQIFLHEKQNYFLLIVFGIFQVVHYRPNMDEAHKWFLGNSLTQWVL